MLSWDFYYGLSYQDFWDFPCIFQDFYYGLLLPLPLPFWQFPAIAILSGPSKVPIGHRGSLRQNAGSLCSLILLPV